jgi:iron complex transport system substrate-binding protein
VTSRVRLTALSAAALLALSGCASGINTVRPETAQQSAAFPVTIEHAFGETAIAAEPERVVTLGWGSTDAAVALGVVPIAVEEQSYGSDENGILPWVNDALERMDAPTPIVIPQTTDDPAYEAIAEAAPDLILAVYSGITEKQYELLSEIAPTVAYPETPWATPWRDVVNIVGSALGKEAEAATVLAGIDDVMSTQAEAHPELAGTSVAVVMDVGGTFYVYTAEDSRVNFLFDLGLVEAPAIEELANGASSFYYTLSYEELDKLDSDILVSFHNTTAESEAFLQSRYAQAIPAVQSGAVASVIGVELIAAVSPPTALSLTWGIERYAALLSAAAAAAN